MSQLQASASFAMTEQGNKPHLAMKLFGVNCPVNFEHLETGCKPLLTVLQLGQAPAPPSP